MDLQRTSDTSAAMRLPLSAAAVLVLVALIGAAAVRWSGISISEPDAAALASRQLRFEVRPDGSIEIFDARSQELVDTVRGEAGFVRDALRGLARERRREGIGAQPPFTLVARTDGRLTLIDPSTGRRVDLESFGPTNAAAFARLLAKPEPPSGRSPP
jgi:putative photosynthetic complex assembly protein